MPGLAPSFLTFSVPMALPMNRERLCWQLTSAVGVTWRSDSRLRSPCTCHLAQTTTSCAPSSTTSPRICSSRGPLPCSSWPTAAYYASAWVSLFGKPMWWSCFVFGHEMMQFVWTGQCQANNESLNLEQVSWPWNLSLTRLQSRVYFDLCITVLWHPCRSDGDAQDKKVPLVTKFKPTVKI